MQAVQVVKEKPEVNQNMNFLASSVYETHDLRDKIKPGQKFVIRQGDLIVANYSIDYPRRHGLRSVSPVTENINGRLIDVFRDSHFILHTEEFMSIYHSEHGLVIIPAKGQRFSYYVINEAID
ncbi:conserved hypothetical protein [Betalipothrixvirus acidiani]|uniref:Uncharacterized protein n=1 Tax=Betalipothrixvirus acidiani TaxID=346881 RepID=A7WKB4_9VIRU|nr:hypothetical protein AFV3_gp25 [Acidianus filamentous virus 3]CAJ31515.1 conserved hypothetical protein [Acidianus filamentous virus 3]